MKLNKFPSDLLTSVFLSNTVAYAAPALKSSTEKISYTIGNNIGMNFKQLQVGINIAAFTRGLQDGLKGVPPAINAEEQKKIMMDFNQEVSKKALERQKQQAVANDQTSKKFLAENANKPGSKKTTASGLQYKVIQAGNGPQPKADDQVTVNYELKLLDGKIIDSSYKNGKPVTFPLADMISGWKEALQLMPVGSTWLLYIPPQLAYGEQGMPPAGIGPQQTLIFKVHLIAIKQQDKAADSKVMTSSEQGNAKS
jgi:FKBP-type peptidyl-prolyl cis-trans isomerase FklB